ncbi:MAG TPA: glutamate mutase L [Ktedonobacterales bacterium]
MAAAIPQAGERRQSQPARALRVLLLLDCGSVFTKAALLSRVDGQMRVFARAQAATTLLPPVGDLSVGMREAVRGVEQITGRTLLRDDRLVVPLQPDGGGADGVVLAVNAGGPLRLLTTGPGREALAGLLHRAIGGLFAQVEPLPTVHLSPQQQMSAEWEQALAQTRAFQPHALVVVGPSFATGRGGGDMDSTIAAISAWLDGLAPATRPGLRRPFPVIFSGDAADAAALSAALHERAFVHEVAGLSPSTLSPLNRAVGALYENVVLRALPGFAPLREVASVPPLAPITALAGMTRYLAQQYQTTVLTVDVGASSTALAGATGAGELLPAEHPTAGVGPGAGAVLRDRGARNVLRWVSFASSEEELREYVLTRMLRRTALPATPRQLEFEHALAREAIALALRAPGSRLAGLHPLDVLLGSGGVLANVPHPAMAALILLDALQPQGITTLALDGAQLAATLGGVAGLDAAAAGEVATRDTVVPSLATVISTAGEAPPGERALRVELEYADGSRHAEDVMAGSLVRMPLAPGAQAVLNLLPAPEVDIGLGPGRQARANDAVDGGQLGLIVDARGRPLALPDDDMERRRLLILWRRALGLGIEE